MVSRTVRHPRAFAYKFGGDEAPPRLRSEAYIPRDLMNCTIASFYRLDDTQLTKRQIGARRFFLRVFQLHAARPFEEIPYEELRAIMSMLLVCLDEFFFLGSLTRDDGSGAQIESLSITKHLGRLRGKTFKVSKNKKWHIRISSSRRHQTSSSLEFIVSTLIHEMVHIFQLSYCCRCSHCQAEDLEGIGIRLGFHGRVFLMLSFAILNQLLMNWDPIFGTELCRSDFWVPWWQYWELSVDGRDDKMGRQGRTAAVADDITYKCTRAAPKDIRIDQLRLRYSVLQTAASSREPFRTWISKV
jgi:hypothetical protein